MTKPLGRAGLLALIPALAHAQPVVNAPALRPFFDGAASRRIDIVGIGDSNQLYQGHGWDHCWSRATALRFGMYATGLLSAGENGGNGAGAGYLYQGFSTLGSGQFAYSGASAFHDAFLAPSPAMSPLNYAHVPPASTASTGFNLGFFIEAGCPLNVNANLRFHYVFGRFGVGGGTFFPTVRLQQPPFSTLVTSPGVSSSGSADDVAWGSLDLPAATRNAALNFRITPWGQPLPGPFIWYYSRAEDLDRAAGAAFHTLYGFGGQSARDMAAALQAVPDQYLSLYFSQVRSLQTGPRRVLIRINTGLNDRNEPEISVGPSPTLPGNSAAAFADNLRAIINRITGVWALNSWSSAELFFLISVSHPVSDPDDAMLTAYRQAADAVALATPRCASFHAEQITTAGEMLSNNWYQASGFDRNHLTQPAYEELARRELFALQPLSCWADVSGNGLVDFQDLNMVLSFFGAAGAGPAAPGIARGDIDGDGDVDFADLNAVLSTFGQACP